METIIKIILPLVICGGFFLWVIIGIIIMIVSSIEEEGVKQTIKTVFVGIGILLYIVIVIMIVKWFLNVLDRALIP